LDVSDCSSGDGGRLRVLAYSTARKTHEIGIRMALGAKGADVLQLVVATGLRLVAMRASRSDSLSASCLHES